MRCAFTGSFDPITIGHINIIERAVALFEKVDVVMLVNPDKKMKFSQTERLDMLRLATEKFSTVTISFFGGMAVDFCKENAVDCIVRGVRNKSDLEYELKMAEYNRTQGNIETLFLMAEEKLRAVSSTASLENENYIPKECLKYIKNLNH